MSLVRMRAKCSHGWMGATVHRGDQYDANDQEATLLEALDWAEKISINLNGTTRKTPQRKTREISAQRPRGYLTK